MAGANARLLLVACCAVQAPQQQRAFEVAWNSPWPSAGSCREERVPADALTRFGVRTNAGNALNGDAVSILYNHPGRYTIGDWPSLWPNGSVFANGGIPQLANLSRHLAQVTADVERLFPAEDFSGIVGIDWEEWEPWLNPNSDSLYARKSFALAGGDRGAAVAAWNASSLEFMVRTLETAKALRPHARWAFYGMVGCAAEWDVAAGRCSAEVRARNDALAPLWRAGTALMPSIYSECPYGPGPRGELPLRCLPGGPPGHPYGPAANSTEAQRIPISLGEAARVNAAGLPILPYTWPALYTQHCAKSPPAGLGHCPLMRSSADLDAEFRLAQAAAGVTGVIVWGSSSDVRNRQDCAEFTQYFNSTLGPLLQSLAL